MKSAPCLVWFAFACVAPAMLSSCGPAVARDLSEIPQRQITFDDMCHLQDFFDQRNATRGARGFRAVDEQQTETAGSEPDERGQMRRVVLGEGTYIVTGWRAKRRLRELLEAEYVRLPSVHLEGRESDVRVHVHWWASGQMRRLRPDREIELTAGGETVALPFNPCVGEFLFGAPIYALRRHVFESDRARAHGELPPPVPIAGDEDAGGASSGGASAAGGAGAASGGAAGDGGAASAADASYDAGDATDG